MSKAEDFLKTSLNEVNILSNSNKVLGSPITLEDGKIIIPFSSVKVCHLSGSSEYASKNSDILPFGGISGGNFQIEPQGFLFIEGNNIKSISLNASSLENIILNKMPEIIKNMKKK